MHCRVARFAAYVFATALLALAGCESTPTNFYILSSLPPAKDVKPETGVNKFSLGVGPVTLPTYLDRRPLVSFASANKLHLDEFHQWAEPLDENFARALAENFSALLGTDHVTIMPGLQRTPIDYQITFAISHFGADRTGNVLLVSQWNIFGKNSNKPLVSRKSRYTESSKPANDPEAVVAAMSRTVDALSQDIVLALKVHGIK